MRVVSVLSGKAVWLFETLEMNPRGIDMVPIYGAVRNRYSFATPKTREEIENSKDGIKFTHGTYKRSETDVFSVQLTIFNDGLVAETIAGTDCAEAFLCDLTGFVHKQHGLYFSQALAIRKRYSSTLLVESEAGLSKLADLLGSVTSLLNSATNRTFSVRSLTLGFESTEQNDGLGPFLFDRRAGVPDSANRYFSMAPITTQEHELVLEKLEESMAKRG